MNEIFSSIYNHLDINLTANVYDHVPQDLPNTDYPFVRVDAVNPEDNGTDTETGFIAEIQVVTYSQYRGLQEINDLMDEIYDELHRWAMPDTTTYGVSGIRETVRSTVMAQDGITRNGVQRYEIIFEPLPA